MVITHRLLFHIALMIAIAAMLALWLAGSGPLARSSGETMVEPTPTPPGYQGPAGVPGALVAVPSTNEGLGIDLSAPGATAENPLIPQPLSVPSTATASDAFFRTWARTDDPIATNEVTRTWMWGPGPTGEEVWEPYAESPGGERLVQYYDKSRMELNDPGSGVVTQGLLALDMMLGRIQVGDTEFIDHPNGASTENVAGDAGEGNGPTYASMSALIDTSPLEAGTAVTQTVDANGQLGEDAELATFGVTASELVQRDWVNHRIASVFWEFMTQNGTVWTDLGYQDDRLFADPFYAVGLPVTEAYWSTVQVDSSSKWVLVQCFERRCLTYTPDNAAEWQVEAANTGLHYLRWIQGANGQ